MPKCSGAVATTLSAAPAPLVLLYTKVVWCERVPVTTVVWNLEGGNLAAAVSARERNDDRAISRNRAPATICNVLHQFAPKPTNQHRERLDSKGRVATRLYVNDLEDALQRIQIGGIACIERQPVGRSC